ncbi:hypothetical protein [Nitrosovibrio sp. Nv4]|uniref:hypothetical protein n=1 Tax=Nitrosovibrio sp. Nv4 TaxID=1945880 RepID=UPI000BCF01EA|nr:hypothetical protein [Nitrosovibrio sp. Nv4]SOD41335.1 hypothetical protein SAMN06298226_1630 [Nitrosovibrio sp. Nv4]
MLKSGDKVVINKTGQRGVIAHVIKDRVSNKTFYQIDFANGKYDLYSKKAISLAPAID